MIRYALKCEKGHGFESWFQSAATFDKVSAARMVSCPACGSTTVEKALMAPEVRSSGTDKGGLGAISGPPATEIEATMAELRRRVEEGSDYVGLNFAAEARAIHDGTAPGRSIWGEAKVEDARRLLEDGIPVAPLPFRTRKRLN